MANPAYPCYVVVVRDYHRLRSGEDSVRVTRAPDALLAKAQIERDFLGDSNWKVVAVAREEWVAP